MATNADYRRAAEAVNGGYATEEQRELNDEAASQSRFMNKLAQDAQDARQGKLK
jgi:hypothetical protein